VEKLLELARVSSDTHMTLTEHTKSEASPVQGEESYLCMHAAA